MKLIDFLQSASLNALKAKMGIPPDVYGSLDVKFEKGRLTPDELERLISGDGLDVGLDDLVFLEDGTIAYKDSRVVLYIRDVHVYGDRESDPRFHVSNCQRLREMKSIGRFERYVVSTKLDGLFSLNVINKGTPKHVHRRLFVCQYCLGELKFGNFDRQRDDREKRRMIVDQFRLDSFFRSYPRSLHSERPLHSSDTAPIDDYVPNWREISERIRRQANWTCEGCNTRFSGKAQRFLHVHHLRQRHDNRREMLMVLCLGCHAKQPNHAHLRKSADFRDFAVAYPGLV